MKLPAPHEIRPMPDDVMNWEKTTEEAVMADLRHGVEPGCKGWVRITEQTYAELTTAEAEVERLREALSIVRNVANGALS